jgi:hypothetical protein
MNADHAMDRSMVWFGIDVQPPGLPNWLFTSR